MEHTKTINEIAASLNSSIPRIPARTRATGVTAAGKPHFDPKGERELIEAYVEPGASIAGLALKACFNANQA